MLKLSDKQIEFVENKIINVFDSLTEKQQEEIDNSDDEDAKLLLFRLKNFEKLKTSEELHYLITNWNWDDGSEIPEKILYHDFCDRGTAQMIYWLAAPNYYVEFETEEDVPNVNREGYAIVKQAEKLLMGNFYKLKNIKFNPKTVASWEDIDDARIPSELKVATEGEEFIF